MEITENSKWWMFLCAILCWALIASTIYFSLDTCSQSCEKVQPCRINEYVVAFDIILMLLSFYLLNLAGKKKGIGEQD